MGHELRILRLRMFDFTFVALSHLTTLLLETSDSAQRLADSCFSTRHDPSICQRKPSELIGPAAPIFVLFRYSNSVPCQRLKYHEVREVWVAIGATYFKSPVTPNQSTVKFALKAVCSQLLLNPNCLAVDFSEVLPCYGHSDEAIAHHHTVTQDGTASCSWVNNER